jgi:hypothetical protein
VRARTQPPTCVHAPPDAHLHFPRRCARCPPSVPPSLRPSPPPPPRTPHAQVLPKILNVAVLLAVHVLVFGVLGFVLFSGFTLTSCERKRNTNLECSTFLNGTCAAGGGPGAAAACGGACSDYFSTLHSSLLQRACVRRPRSCVVAERAVRAHCCARCPRAAPRRVVCVLRCCLLAVRLFTPMRPRHPLCALSALPIRPACLGLVCGGSRVRVARSCVLLSTCFAPVPACFCVCMCV